MRNQSASRSLGARRAPLVHTPRLPFRLQLEQMLVAHGEAPPSGIPKLS